MKKTTKIVCYLLGFIVFFAGLFIFLYPVINNFTLKNDTNILLDNFNSTRNRISQLSDNSKKQNNSDTTSQKNASNIYDQLYYDMQKYNENIFSNKQNELNDVWSYEQAAFDLTPYGIYDNVVGEIRIPKMNVDLPLLLGASTRNMAKGAVQLGKTSTPIGGINTNCVIAGHRGSSGGEFFLNIEKLEKGDMVYIENFWDTLAYKVTKIDVINPNEIDKILIQKGKDMVTLITCHPYPYNYKRYVVYCERIANDESKNSSSNISTSPNNETNVTDSANEFDNGSFVFMQFECVLYFVVPVLLIVLVIFLLKKNITQKFKTDKNK